MAPLAPSSSAAPPPRFKPGYNAANTPAPPPVPVRMADGRFAIVAGPVAEILSGTTASVTAGGVGGDAAGVGGIGTVGSASRSSIEAKEPQHEHHLDGHDMIIDSASTAVPGEVEEEEESLIDSGVIEAALLLDGGIQWEEDGGRGRGGGTGGGGRGGGGGEDLGRLSIPNNPGRSTAVAAAGLAWMMGADDDYLSAGGSSLQQIPAELLAAIHEDHRNVSGRASLQQVEDIPQEDDFSPDIPVSGKLNDSDFMSESEGNNNYDGDFPEEEADSMPPFRIQVDPGDEDVEPSPLHVVAKQQIASKLKGGSGGGGGGGGMTFSAEDLIDD